MRGTAGFVAAAAAALVLAASASAKTTFTNFSLAATPPNPAGISCPGSSLCYNGAAEPAIRATPNGLFYASSENGLGSGTLAWMSRDGGKHYSSLLSPNNASVGSISTGQEAGVEPGGGDTDVAVATATNALGNYNAYVASLTLASVDVSTTADNGASWSLNPAAAMPIDDRPWIAATGASKVCISYLTAPGILAPELGLHVGCSSDAGTTWTQLADGYDTSAAGQGCSLGSRTGNLAFDPSNGNYLYAIAACGTVADASNPNPTGMHVVVVAVSTDGGQTFTDHVAYLNPNTSVDYENNFPNIAVDKAGNVYATYSDDTSVFYSYSTDHGQTWHGPVQVSKSGETAIYPWTTAGSSGKVDIVYYKTPFLATTANPNPSNFPSTAAWTVGFAQNLSATKAGSSFTETTATPVVHFGAVCQSGAGCTGNRDLFDDFGVAASPTSGMASIVYSDDQFAANEPGSVNSPSCTGASVSNSSSCDHTSIATQTGGAGIFNLK
ncbi:MAG TPA: hypothetical protein VFA96_07660 [Nocardioides sp.]|nr:hypothetical protein [Nocardioides sp.]